MEGAFLGFAIGDALGWPHEDRSRIVGTRSERKEWKQALRFHPWVRRAGGRFYAHEEPIQAGAYSDDTQLLLCTARSVTFRDNWWPHFAMHELPSWSLYERGGGKATKAAAAAWATGQPPWGESQSRQARADYFSAGGNGAAMRILPHALVSRDPKDFRVIASNILANSICTHAHPRALLGALVYGYAVWLAFHKTGTLRYGELIEELLDSPSRWSELPGVEPRAADWRVAADSFGDLSYGKAWTRTVAEIKGLLEKCQSAIRQGALLVDRALLRELGAFERKERGSGTISAAAAIFLASRYAVSPMTGLLEAAFADGTDTDTIAAMTGGLLGVLRGTEPFEPLCEGVQDSRYIRHLAQHLTVESARPDVHHDAGRFVARNSSSKAILEMIYNRERVVLPDGRSAEVASSSPLKARSSTLSVESFELSVSDGQTIFLKRIQKSSRARPQDRGLFESSAVTEPVREVSPQWGPYSARQRQTRIGVILAVEDIVKTRDFYQRVLGLRIMHQTERLVNFGGTLSLVPVSRSEPTKLVARTRSDGEPGQNQGIRIQIQINNFDDVLTSVLRSGAHYSQVSSLRQKRFFRCTDPEGNIVEVLEA